MNLTEFDRIRRDKLEWFKRMGLKGSEYRRARKILNEETLIRSIDYPRVEAVYHRIRGDSLEGKK